MPCVKLISTLVTDENVFSNFLVVVEALITPITPGDVSTWLVRFMVLHLMIIQLLLVGEPSSAVVALIFLIINVPV